MELDNIGNEEMSKKVLDVCSMGDDHSKDQLIRESKTNPKIAASTLNNLYELIDHDLNFLIEVLRNSSSREKTTILNSSRDQLGIREMFDEYKKETLRETEIEDIVEGRDLDIIWEIKKGRNNNKLSRAYLTRCLLTIAYHIGFNEEIKTFFESEKRKYLTLH